MNDWGVLWAKAKALTAPGRRAVLNCFAARPGIIGLYILSRNTCGKLRKKHGLQIFASGRSCNLFRANITPDLQCGPRLGDIVYNFFQLSCICYKTDLRYAEPWNIKSNRDLGLLRLNPHVVVVAKSSSKSQGRSVVPQATMQHRVKPRCERRHFSRSFISLSFISDDQITILTHCDF